MLQYFLLMRLAQQDDSSEFTAQLLIRIYVLCQRDVLPDLLLVFQRQLPPLHLRLFRRLILPVWLK